MTILPRVTAVVLTWNAERHVVACVQSLRRSTAVALDVVVVDNASADGTLAQLRASGVPVTIVETGANLGYAAGNNVGIRHALAAGAEFVLIVNDDTEIDPEALGHLVEALRADPGAAAAAPTILHEAPPRRIWWAGGDFRIARALATHRGYGVPVAEDAGRASEAVDSLCGCGLLVRREALERLGGFREDFFMYGEDVEWSLRARRAAWRLLHVPAARMIHKVPYPEAAPTPEKIRLRDRNRRRLVRTHYGWRDRLRFVVWFYPSRALHLVRYLLRADLPRVRAIWDGAIEP